MATGDTLSLIPAKLTFASPVIRYIVATDLKDCDRSLLLHNVPPLVKEKHVSAAFARLAPLESVTCVASKSTLFTDYSDVGFHKMTVVFRDASGPQAARAVTQESPIILSVPLSDSQLVTPNVAREEERQRNQERMAMLKGKADEIVKLYDEEVRLKDKVAKTCAGEADEEWWQVVRRSRPESLNKEKALLSRLKAKEEKKQRLEANVAQVYQYRMRNEKLVKLRQLRKKFEEDKFKIALMKAGRKFKPM